MENFRKLGLPDSILKVIEQDKFEKPSEIQEKAIPLVLTGKDVIAESATGSGKTLAFGAGIIENCNKIGVIQSLVLTPTRELADQVAKSLKHFSKNKQIEIAEVYGGVAISPQISKLRRADVVVGTPGRILDHLEKGTLDLGYVKILVLDEADRMLDMGFIDDVKKIIQECPSKRQTLLFSATISNEIIKIANDYMHQPIEISAEPMVDPNKLTQVYYDVPDNMKFSLLVHLLKQEHSGLVMVFCNTQRNTDSIARNLQTQGIETLAIHGGLSQDKRSKIMNLFHSNKVCVLVCTDIAARGLDIKGVSHIYNYDAANEPNNYIHRIGRTARAGKEGIAINIISSRDYDNFSRIIKLQETKIQKLELPEIKRVGFFVKQSRSFSRSNNFSSGNRNSRFGRRDRSRRIEGRRNEDRGESRFHNRTPSRNSRRYSRSNSRFGRRNRY